MMSHYFTPRIAVIKKITSVGRMWRTETLIDKLLVGL